MNSYKFVESLSKKSLGVICTVSLFWVVALSRVHPLTDFLVWGIPCLMLAIYACFELWHYGTYEKKHPRTRKTSTAESLSWPQRLLECGLFMVLTILTNGLLRGNVEGINGLHTAGVALLYIIVVPKLLKIYVWPKWPARQR